MAGHVQEVTDADFEARVLARSHKMPVLVDFWAPWCGPCRALAPVLEKLAEEFAGRVEIVKLNTDMYPDTSQRYAIRSIPAVKLFRAGAVTAEFAGAQSEAVVRRFLDNHCPSELDELASTGLAALERGDLERARVDAELVLASIPDHAIGLLVMGKLALRSRDYAAAKALMMKVPSRAKEWELAQATIALCDLVQSGVGGTAANEALVIDDPTDQESRFRYACALIGDGREREGLEQLLLMVELDKRWNDEAARHAMLIVFASIGARHPLADEYRRKLAVLL